MPGAQGYVGAGRGAGMGTGRPYFWYRQRALNPNAEPLPDPDGSDAGWRGSELALRALVGRSSSGCGGPSGCGGCYDAAAGGGRGGRGGREGRRVVYSV
jgi:hypothetical protein